MRQKVNKMTDGKYEKAKEVISIMKREWIREVMIIGFLLLLIAPNHVLAETDSDADGFIEYQGITTRSGVVYPPPPCPGGDRTLCVDPNTKDLFVIMADIGNPINPYYHSGSCLRPADWPADIPTLSENCSLIPVTSGIEILSNPATTAGGGLGLAIHIIPPDALYKSNRTVSDMPNNNTQKAIKITESPDASGTGCAGAADYGTPNDADNAVVYTAAILKFIKDTCGTRFGGSNCIDSAGNTGYALVANYIRHAIAHESGHMLFLAGKSTAAYGGNHYNTKDQVEMSQSVYYWDDGTTVTFYIGNKFKTADQSGRLGFKLK